MIPLVNAADELLTLRDLLRYAVSRFEQAGLYYGHGWPGPREEAAYLITHTLHLPLTMLAECLDARLLREERLACLRLLQRRISERMPAAYLTREAWLGGLRFHVDPRVIVPRSFIAELLDGALMPWIADPEDELACLDMCTGSGCLAVLLSHAFPHASVDAAELSPAALAVARMNVAAHQVAERVQLLHSDRYAALTGRRYDLIVCNPPYVTTASMRALPPEYRHEPSMALAAGSHGLDFIDGLLRESAQHLEDDGILVVEVGNNRALVEEAYPELDAVWLETSAAFDPVFLVTREQLVAAFAADTDTH